jgi:hypothetical protein
VRFDSIRHHDAGNTAAYVSLRGLLLRIVLRIGHSAELGDVPDRTVGLGQIAMNKQWHEQNRMPAKATLEQRIEWHREHQQHCACREAPKNLQPYLKKKATQGFPGCRNFRFDLL